MAYIPDALRHLVRQRAQERCEYCLLHSENAFFTHEIDHVYAEKHGGQTNADNLCYSCFDCNRHKGSDIASIDPQTGQIVALFNPRAARWSEHFRHNGAEIEPLTPEGRGQYAYCN